MATIYFTCGDYKNCLNQLNNIINDNPKSLHEDVQTFYRLLNLIVHYGLQNYDVVFVQLKFVYRFLLKKNEGLFVQKRIIQFLHQAANSTINDIPVHPKALYDDIKHLERDPYEKRAFLYLDIVSWLESKLNKEKVEKVIQRKRLTKLKQIND
jgi:hypothetical protein